MPSIDQKQRAERRVLRLLTDTGLPIPDEVEYGEYCVRFLWHDLKVALVVDLDDYDEVEEHGGLTHDGLVM